MTHPVGSIMWRLTALRDMAILALQGSTAVGSGNMVHIKVALAGGAERVPATFELRDLVSGASLSVPANAHGFGRAMDWITQQALNARKGGERNDD